MHALTIDIDWAPDFAIRHTADLLLKNNVKCTWFVTHKSDVVDYLAKNHQDLFEFGIHPNFLVGSSHGKTVDEVFKHIIEIMPSRIMRTHALYQSSPILKKAVEEYNMKIDCSLFLPGAIYVEPHVIYLSESTPLFRVPYIWEDDEEANRKDKSWDVSLTRTQGLQVYNFHPMYIYLNSDTMDGYNNLKKSILGKIPLNQTLMPDVSPFINKEKDGAGTFFENLLSRLSRQEEATYTVSEIEKIYSGIGDRKKF